MFKLRQIISRVRSEPHRVMLWISQTQGAVLSCLVVSEWMIERVCVCVSMKTYVKNVPIGVMEVTSQVGLWRSAWMSNRMLLCSLSLPSTLKVKNSKKKKKKQSRHALCLPSSGPTTSEPRCVKRKVFPSWWSCCALTLTRWSELWPSPCATCRSTAATRTWSVQTVSSTTHADLRNYFDSHGGTVLI